MRLSYLRLSERYPTLQRQGLSLHCRSYRGITLQLVPGKVFSHVLLARIRPVLLAHRRQQSGFTPGRSTCDRILTLNLITQRWREFGRPTYAAYVDLRSAFDSISQPALWLLLSRLGIPGKIINLMKSLYDQSVSCV